MKTTNFIFEWHPNFEPYFYCACAEMARILLPASNLTTPFDPACPKTYMSVKLWLKTLF